MRAQALILLFAAPAIAADLVVMAAPPIDVCDGPRAVIEVRLGPNGAYDYIPPAVCRKVPGPWNTWHWIGGTMVNSQQAYTVGAPCPNERMTVDRVTFGRVAPELWAVCGTR